MLSQLDGENIKTNVEAEISFLHEAGGGLGF
jgi:hypothetical protein